MYLSVCLLQFTHNGMSATKVAYKLGLKYIGQKGGRVRITSMVAQNIDLRLVLLYTVMTLQDP